MFEQVGRVSDDDSVKWGVDKFSQDVQELIQERLFNTIADITHMHRQWKFYRKESIWKIQDKFSKYRLHEDSVINFY